MCRVEVEGVVVVLVVKLLAVSLNLLRCQLQILTLTDHQGELKIGQGIPCLSIRLLNS